jgi:hypothetical protein
MKVINRPLKMKRGSRVKVIRETIGDVDIYIQTIDAVPEVIGEPPGGRATQVTGISDDLKDAYGRLKGTITGVAKDIGTDMRRLSASARPKSLEIEFDVGLSAEVGPILLNGKGEYNFKVKMTWEFENDEPGNDKDSA